MGNPLRFKSFLDSLMEKPLLEAVDGQMNGIVLTPLGPRLVPHPVLSQHYTQEVIDRVEQVETSVQNATTYWPVARKIELEGHAVGEVSMDGRNDVILHVTIPDATLPMMKTIGLPEALNQLQINVDAALAGVVSNANLLDTKLNADGTAVAAQRLATPRTINGVAFDGTENIEVSFTGNPDKHGVFEQTELATVWIVSHGMGKYPSVITTDSSMVVMSGRVRYIDLNTVEIIHNEPQVGFTICN